MSIIDGRPRTTAEASEIKSHDHHYTPDSEVPPDFVGQSALVIHADPKIGIGGAPTRATTLPEGAADRKKFPVASGCLDYFPDALVAISHLSYRGNQQHNPDKPLHWDRSKSADEDDTLIRHFLQRGTRDTDDVRHTVKLAWRALALLQKELEAAAAAGEKL